MMINFLRFLDKGRRDMLMTMKKNIKMKKFFIRFYSYGFSEKGRKGIFASHEDEDNFYKVFPEMKSFFGPKIRIYGYSHQRKWQGDLPKDDEIWFCEFVKITEGGLVLVRPIYNETKRKKIEHRDQLFSQASNLELFLEYVDISKARLEGEDDCDVEIRIASYILWLKEFAEEKIAPKGKLPMIRQMIEKEDWQLSFTDVLDYSYSNEFQAAFYDHKADCFMGHRNSLKAIIAWLERKENIHEIRDIGKRHFRCNCCSHVFRLGKKEYKKLKDEGFAVRCPDCGASAK